MKINWTAVSDPYEVLKTTFRVMVDGGKFYLEHRGDKKEGKWVVFGPYFEKELTEKIYKNYAIAKKEASNIVIDYACELKDKEKTLLLPAKFEKMSMERLLLDENIDLVVKELTVVAMEHINDFSTKKARVAIKTNAHKARKSAIYFRKKVDAYIDGFKKKIEKADMGSLRLENAMKELKQKLMVPYDEFEAKEIDKEAKEEIRIKSIHENIEMLKEQFSLSEGKTSDEIQVIIDSLGLVEIDLATYSEYTEEAELVKAEVIGKLKIRLDGVVPAENTAKELAVLRENEAKRMIINKKIEDIRGMVPPLSDSETSVDIEKQINILRNISINHNFGDQAELAAQVQGSSLDALLLRLDLRKKAEKDAEELRKNAKELDDFRKEKADREKKKEEEKVINDLFQELGDKHESSLAGMSTPGWHKYIAWLGLQSENIDRFGERSNEAAIYLSKITDSAKTFLAKQEKEDEEAVKVAEEAAKKAKAEADAKAKKEAEEKEVADAKEKADKEAADLEFQKKKTDIAVDEVRTFLEISEELSLLLVDYVKEGRFQSIIWK